MYEKISTLSRRLAAVCGTAYLLLADSVLAGTANIPDVRPTDPGTVGPVTGVANNLVTSALNILIFIAGAVAVIFVIWGGYKYITSAGDPKKGEEARKTIINAMIGIMIVVASYFIVRVAISAGQTVTTVDSGINGAIKFR